MAILLFWVLNQRIFSRKTCLIRSAGLHQELKTVSGVTGVLSIPETVTLGTDSVTGKLAPQKIFHLPYENQAALDSDRAVFESLPFTKHFCIIRIPMLI